MTLSTGQIGLPQVSINTLDYAGAQSNYVPVTSANRAPTIYDRNYATSCEWSNTVTLDIWKLYGFNSGDADWRLLASGGGGGGIQTLSDNSNVTTSPDGMGNVKLAVGPGLTTTAGVSTITIDLVGGGVATESVNVDTSTGPGTDPVLPNGGGQMQVTGGQRAPGTIANAVQTHSYAASAYTIEIQQADTSAAKDVTLNGIAHFNSAQFTTDEGFISAIGGASPPMVNLAVDTFVPPGTNPVIADAGATITLTGSQVASGLVGANVIRTESLAANSCTIEIQRSDVAAVSDPTVNGVAHFDSAFFNIDVDGFVSLNAAGSNIQGVTVDDFTGPGTNPVVPDGGGLIAVTGALVAAGTTPIQTDSLAANTYTVEVQTTQSAAAADSTKNGLAHFLNTDFTVDADGFVSLVTPGGGGGPSGNYGDGSDGTVTFDGVATILSLVPVANVYSLTRDLYLASSTIDAGVSLVTKGFRIFCNGTLTNNGTIQWNGNVGGNAIVNFAPGAGASALNNSGSSISASTGASSPGTAGGTGADGGSGGGFPGSPGVTALTNNSFGGVGGTGGLGAAGPGIQAPGVGGSLVAVAPDRGSIRAMPLALLGKQVDGSGLYKSICAGTGGGGGGGYDFLVAGSAGGGGGSGGGIVVVAAFIFAGVGVISANGGAGGNAADFDFVPGLGAGGGGGGGGGVVIVISSSASGGAVAGQNITVSGGTGGAPTGAGAIGSTGNTGTTIVFTA